MGGHRGNSMTAFFLYKIMKLIKAKPGAPFSHLRAGLQHPFFKNIISDIVYYNVGAAFYWSEYCRNLSNEEIYKVTEEVESELWKTCKGDFWSTTAGQILILLNFGYNVIIYEEHDINVSAFECLKDFTIAEVQ